MTVIVVWMTAAGQKSEFRLCANTGLFAFKGPSAERVSFIINSKSAIPEDPISAYTNNPYGSDYGISFGISGNFKKVSKKNFLAGADIGVEMLRSQVFINSVLDGNSYSASGKTILQLSFINLQPFIGQRFYLQPVSIDLTGGVDFGFRLQAKEIGKATTTNARLYKTSVNRNTITTDIRPRFQMSANYKKFGVYTSYSTGLVNYKAGYIGGTNECYSRLWRFGLTYLLK